MGFDRLTRNFTLTLNGKSYDVEVGDLSENPVTVVVDGWEHKVTVPQSVSSARPLDVPTLREQNVRPPVATPVVPRPKAATSDDSALRAPMPGRIVRVNVGVGDAVSEGDALVVLESMKMENTLSSSVAGVVSAVHVSEEDSVQQGQTLLEFG